MGVWTVTRAIFLKSRSVQCVGVALIALCGTLLSPITARATSAFDGVVDKARTLKISGSNGSCTTDITTSWFNLLQQASVGGAQFPYQDQEYLTDAYDQLLENQQAGSGWGLWEVKHQGKYSVQLVIFPPDTEFQFEYTSSGTPTPILNGYHTEPEDVYFVEMAMYDCSPRFTVRGPSWLAVGEYPDHISYQNFDNPSEISYMVETKIFFINYYSITYPTGYEGETIPTSGAWADLDGDGLVASEETSQGTSNASKDTDGDGIDDFKESVWFNDRDEVFCGISQCIYPNPTEKDIYVEIDWMNSGMYIYKPSAAQLGLVEDAFANKNINIHFDTGRYGGGSELPAYVSELKFAPDIDEVDFFNLKNGDEIYDASFSENRRGIWHYLITGNKRDNASTGAAYPSDDDAYVAIGRVKELAVSPIDEDVAVAGTIIHELGHNLCLSDITYTGQDPSCLFTGVDTYAGHNYISSMNYDKQLGLVDYSEGLNTTGDHDDWGAVMIGIDDFVTLGEDPSENQFRGTSLFDKPLLDQVLSSKSSERVGVPTLLFMDDKTRLCNG